MHLISIILFAFTANIDSFFIGICYGAKNTHVSFSHNLLIGAVVCVSTIFSMGLGKSLSEFMVFSFSQILGSIILIILGVYYLISFIRSKHDSPVQSYDEKTAESVSTIKNYLSLKETLLIGLGLALNNIAMGIGASITGIAVLPTSIATLAFSIVFLYLGNKIGANYIPNFIIKYAEPLTSILIILLGVYEMFI